MTLKKLTYSHGEGRAPTVLAYGLDGQNLTLFCLDENSGPCVSNHLIGITDKICAQEDIDNKATLNMRFQMGLRFSAAFWIFDLPYETKQIAVNGVRAFMAELNEAMTPNHLRVSRSLAQYQEWSNDGSFDLPTPFNTAAGDGYNYAVIAIPHELGHGGYIFAKPEFMGSSLDHKYETLIVPTNGLIGYTGRHDPDMLDHAERKFGDQSIAMIITRNDLMRPLNAGSWAINPALGYLVFNTGDAGVLKVFNNADIPFFPVSVSKGSDERLMHQFKAEMRSLTVNPVGPRDHLRLV